MALSHLPEWEGLAIDLSGVDSAGLYDERGRGGTGRLGPRAAAATTRRAADTVRMPTAATPDAEAPAAEMGQIEGRGNAQPAATMADASVQPSSTMSVLAATRPLPPIAVTAEVSLSSAQLRHNRRAVRFED